MIKIFTNLRPRPLIEQIDKEILLVSLASGDVKVPESYTWECEYDCQVLKQAINLSNFLDSHGIDISVGLTCDPNEMYPGWVLLIETGNYEGSFKPIVSRFFTWSSVENQHILDFDELIQDSWD